MPIILATEEAEIRGSQFQASLGKKLARPHLNQWLGVLMYAYHLSYVGSINRRIAVHAGLGINARPCLKNN
jgi:hypothetical protein